MTEAIAVDCCWLVGCSEASGEFSSILQLLALMESNEVSLLLDFDHKILGEYHRNVTAGLGRQFFQSCVRNGRVSYLSGSLTNAQNAALDAIAFDPSDRVYLAVASKQGSAPYLTREEKHLAPNQASRIVAATGVPVVDTSGAIGLVAQA